MRDNVLFEEKKWMRDNVLFEDRRWRQEVLECLVKGHSDLLEGFLELSSALVEQGVFLTKGRLNMINFYNVYVE
jgi:hypothetical protein